MTSFIIYSPNIILFNFGACSNSNTLNETALSFEVTQAEKNIVKSDGSTYSPISASSALNDGQKTKFNLI